LIKKVASVLILLKPSFHIAISHLVKLAAYVIFIGYLLSFQNLLAQHSKTKIAGVIKDGKTLTDLSYATILSQSGTFSSKEISIRFQFLDTLTISHINYEQYKIPVKDVLDSILSVYLLPKSILLNEVLILALPL